MTSSSMENSFFVVIKVDAQEIFSCYKMLKLVIQKDYILYFLSNIAIFLKNGNIFMYILCT